MAPKAEDARTPEEIAQGLNEQFVADFEQKQERLELISRLEDLETAQKASKKAHEELRQDRCNMNARTTRLEALMDGFVEANKDMAVGVQRLDSGQISRRAKYGVASIGAGGGVGAYYLSSILEWIGRLFTGG